MPYRTGALQPGEIDGSLQVAADYCGSCYGAKGAVGANGAIGKCCNTCKEVADAYTAMGWALHDIRRTAEQVSRFCIVTGTCHRACGAFASIAQSFLCHIPGRSMLPMLGARADAFIWVGIAELVKRIHEQRDILPCPAKGLVGLELQCVENHFHPPTLSNGSVVTSACHRQGRRRP